MLACSCSLEVGTIDQCLAARQQLAQTRSHSPPARCSILSSCASLRLPAVRPRPAVVTCGGLCPGLNDVVQGLVSKLTDYGVPEGHILGIR